MADFTIAHPIGLNGRVYHRGEEDALAADAEESDTDLSHLKESGALEEASSGGESAGATGAAKELADEEGIDLADVDGTGKGGRIKKSDVQDAVEA